MIKYFLDTSAIWQIHKIKKYANFSIIVSSKSKNRWLLRFIMPKADITVWYYIDMPKTDIQLNNELKVLKTAINYEEKIAPDELIYVTHDKTLAHLANYYFGEDSILII